MARGKAVFLDGPNFSGRTALLRRWIFEPRREDGPGIYIGPDVQQTISSLTATVRHELLLHAVGSSNEDYLFHLANSFGLDRCLNQSPFTLSGGEQVLLATLCQLALGASRLSLDGTLEELDRENAVRAVQLLSSQLASNTATILTANGYPEDRPWQPAQRLFAADFDRQDPFREPPRLNASDFLFTAPPRAGCLAADGLAFAYPGGSPLLRNICFRLEPGSIYSLEGRNGAGKSTLARLLVGALRLRQGQIFFDEKIWDPWRTPGRHVVLHLQNPNTQLFAEHVEGELANLPEPARQHAANFAGVNHLRSSHPFDMPFVLRKRLSLSAVVHLSKPWFILDEPTLGQDALACDQIAVVLRRMAAGGAGVIIISHSQEFLRRLNPRRLKLEDGRLRELGSST